MTFILPFFTTIGKFVNSHIMKAKLIRALFLQKKQDLYNNISKQPFLKESTREEKEDIREELWPIRFSAWDKIKFMFPDFFVKDYQIGMFELGENLLMNECNIFTIVESLMKIKASLIVLIGQDHKKQMQIQEQYLNMATLHVPNELEKCNHNPLEDHLHEHPVSEYSDFL